MPRFFGMLQRLFVVVTGASRGFGKHVAQEFVRAVAHVCDLDLLLMARNPEGLRSTAAAIEEVRKSFGGVRDVDVRQEAVDLGDLDSLEDRLDTVFHRVDPSRYSQAFLVSNGGSIGHVSSICGLPSLSILRSEVDLNVTSAMWLSSRFARVFGIPQDDPPEPLPSKDEVEDVKGGVDAGDVPKKDATNMQHVIVNVSSLAALQPFRSWGAYSAGKAARDMFHRVLALENEQEQGILKVLNYAPGPMDTDMSRQIRSQEEYEDDVRSGRLVDPRLSAEKCVRIALSGKFSSGAHVDFFDEENK